MEHSEIRSSCHIGVKETMQRMFKQEEEKGFISKALRGKPIERKNNK
jgi:hypothetical protein